MEAIGLVIKTERLRQGMKQISLSKGICTPSYLSKIENNLVKPSEDVISLLLKRLNININNKINQKEKIDYLSEVYSLYKNCLINKNKSDLEKVRFYVENELDLKDRVELYNFKLYQIRFCLILNELNSAKSLINTLENIKKDFNPSQNFKFNLNYGLYFYLNGDYIKSTEFLEKNIGLINTFAIDSCELADYYYAISVAYLRSNQVNNAFQYAKSSLRMFLDNHFFYRAIDSYIVIALAQKRNKLFKDAENNLNLAMKLSNQFNIVNSIGIIYQNLGALFAMQEESEKAIEYYNISLNNDRGMESRLITILSIIQEYSKNKGVNQVRYWAQRGLLEIEKSDIKNQEYYYHFITYLYLYLYDKNINFEKKIKAGIKFFEKRQDYRHVYKYSYLLANHLYEQKKYKLSGIYFKKAHDAILKEKLIVNWEEL